MGRGSGRGKASKKENWFLGDKVPQELENKVLAVYTDLCVEHAEQDLTSKYLYQMATRLGIDKRFVCEMVLQDYCIHGTHVLDIDVVVLQLSRLMILTRHLSEIVTQWVLILKQLSFDTMKIGEDEDDVFAYKITARDLQSLFEELSIQGKDMDTVGMISICGKTYIGFTEFGMVLGKLGHF